MSFFKDFGKKISSKSKEISQKAKIMSETSSLNNIIRGEECKIDFQYKTIGKLYFEKYGDNPQEEFAEAIDNIRNAQEKIDQTQAEIAKIKARFNCPNCGAPFKHDSIFCSKCGTKLPENTEEKEEQAIPEGAQKCQKCGNILKSNAIFCNECGAKLESSETTTTDEKSTSELLTTPSYIANKEDTAETKEDNATVEKGDAVKAEVKEEEKLSATQEATSSDEQNTEETPTKKCPHCGNEMYEDDLFCNECGGKYE